MKKVPPSERTREAIRSLGRMPAEERVGRCQMNGRYLAAVLTAVAMVFLVPVGVMGQTQTTAADNWSPPRTPWGDPNLQGIWTNTTNTPLERPDDLAAQELLTDEQRAALDAAGEQARAQQGAIPGTGQTGAYNKTC